MTRNNDRFLADIRGIPAKNTPDTSLCNDAETVEATDIGRAARENDYRGDTEADLFSSEPIKITQHRQSDTKLKPLDFYPKTTLY